MKGGCSGSGFQTVPGRAAQSLVLICRRSQPQECNKTFGIYQMYGLSRFGRSSVQSQGSGLAMIIQDPSLDKATSRVNEL